MSLFKVRELWKTSCGSGEEVCDKGCLLVADLRGEGHQQLIVGSHAGFLRVYNVHSPDGFSPVDLLLEVQLDQPILQLAVGKFVSGSQMEYLAVLHPRRLAVYSLVAVPGSTEHGDQWEIRMAYVEELPRSAFSMVVGGFGGVQGRDFLCLLSLDGNIIFLEQETLTGTSHIPNFLLPSDLVYIPHTDSFVTVSADWRLQSFRYQTLAEEGPPLPSWSFNLGEEVLEMYYVPLTTNSAAIFLLTSRNFFCFNEIGAMKFTKRLNYTPVCSHVYSRGEPTVMSMIVSDSNHLLLYEDSKLVWAALLNFSPVTISRISLQMLAGCLVLLSETGELEVGYLGTEPSLFVPPPLPTSVTADSQLEEKLSTLQHQIATYSSSHKESIGLPQEKKELKITGKVWESDDVSVVIEVKLEASAALHSINLSVDCPSTIKATPQQHFIQSITDSVEVSSQLTLVEAGLLTDLTCTIICSYVSGEQSAGVASFQISLPLHFVLQLSPPNRGLKYSLNLTASQVLMLTALFSDFRESSWKETGSNEFLAGFSYKGRPEMNFSINLNRPALKYRIESDSLSALTLPVCILKKKLAGKHLRCSQYSVALPLLFDEVDRNLQIRNTIRRLDEELRVGCAQMRACQRRLLNKMRDKTPTDIGPLSALISYTHNYIMEAAHNMESAFKELEDNGFLLESLIKLAITLIKLNGSASDDEVDNLYEALVYTHQLSEDQGWAEVTRVSLNNLLKTTLARSVRDQFGSDSEGITRLKKLIATAIDRVVRGPGHQSTERGVSPIPEGEDEDGKDGHSVHESDELNRILQESELNLNHL